MNPTLALVEEGHDDREAGLVAFTDDRVREKIPPVVLKYHNRGP